MSLTAQGNSCLPDEIKKNKKKHLPSIQNIHALTCTLPQKKIKSGMRLTPHTSAHKQHNNLYFFFFKKRQEQMIQMKET